MQVKMLLLQVTHPINIDDLPNKEARPVLKFEYGFRYAANLVSLSAESNGASDPPSLRDTSHDS